MQIGHWLGLGHTWAQSTLNPKAAACAASADYTSIVTVENGDSDGVRDTPPQATDSSDRYITFSCNNPDAMFTPSQSCTPAVGFPQGGNFFANGANIMVCERLGTWGSCLTAR